MSEITIYFSIRPYLWLPGHTPRAAHAPHSRLSRALDICMFASKRLFPGSMGLRGRRHQTFARSGGEDRVVQRRNVARCTGLAERPAVWRWRCPAIDEMDSGRFYFLAAFCIDCAERRDSRSTGQYASARQQDDYRVQRDPSLMSSSHRTIAILRDTYARRTRQVHSRRLPKVRCISILIIACSLHLGAPLSSTSYQRRWKSRGAGKAEQAEVRHQPSLCNCRSGLCLEQVTPRRPQIPGATGVCPPVVATREHPPVCA
jgi:hypothetical protein